MNFPKDKMYEFLKKKKIEERKDKENSILGITNKGDDLKILHQANSSVSRAPAYAVQAWSRM